ncbi:MAG: hypothetical protein PHI98_10425 [Eubacteriales bacterium]|nr:hypothetical protein [Eubacteriales bacterium]
MNPFDHRCNRLDENLMNWSQLAVKPYDKRTVDPYTRTRVILMNGAEFENVWFSHQFSRHCDNGDTRRALALIRREEQQQQKLISALKPANENMLEHTIGYEQLAVDLTACLAKREPDPYVKAALDFALLEDFDHLYRYANLLDMENGIHAERLVGGYTEVMPGRPTISEHRYPFDSIKKPIDSKTAKLETALCVGVITAAEQQTMNFYMNLSGSYPNDHGRALYREIGMIEEQHVSHYGSLMDVNCTWLEVLLMHQYTECYLYYSCMETETDPAIKQVWEMLFRQELCHLAEAAKLLFKEEKKEYQQVVGEGEFPPPLRLESNIDYVRSVLSGTVQTTASRESYAQVSALEPDADFFRYQGIVNKETASVPSHHVIDEHIHRLGEDYRFETAPNPIEELRSRVTDNVDVGRKANAAQTAAIPSF